MTQEEKQILLVDLCARLPYCVVVRCTNSDTDYNCFLTADILHEIQNGHDHYDYKPYLRPMSSMTEDEKDFYDSMFIDIEGNLLAMFPVVIIDWLNENHFDYRGLIPMGLALEAPKDMYKIE